ncbi:VWA domain-containing protein [Paenibacillus ginsengarvi]|uniref:VWA domain-containing protein n=1 Tax=Paenibacillus ginsengarvi TaxID=400777 RepID=A0A3B0CEC6_9BACL|nr:VWA domain-containing protein [Paenibacillus ginsengarvi]RKN84425.1 VWA domain-containing protein [Paenibacillus ginsengarvi]
MSHEPAAVFYPFCAVVGQPRAQKALLLHAVNGRIGSVLLCGERGAGKSTLLRGIGALLPRCQMLAVPAHVTEDRLFGGLDAAAAAREGRKRLAPGLLAEADGRWLAVDDAQLMPERLLQAILQTSGDGVIRIEREGLSEYAPTRFRLIGAWGTDGTERSRPRLDYWGICVTLERIVSPEQKMEIIRHQLDFERDPLRFTDGYAAETSELRNKIGAAAKRLADVAIGSGALRLMAELIGEANAAGNRAEIVLAETARAIAAWEGDAEVVDRHVQEAAGYALPHLLAVNGSARSPNRRDGEKPEGNGETQRDRERPTPEPASRKSPGRPGGSGGPSGGSRSGDSPGTDGQPADAAAGNTNASGAVEMIETIGREIATPPISFTYRFADGGNRDGKRNKIGAGPGAGRYMRAALPRGRVRDLAFDATLRAAAMFQPSRRARLNGEHPCRVLIEPGDLREKVRENRAGTALLFVVDASASMHAARRMSAVKGAVLALLRDAYRQRDRVGLIAFRGDRAELLLDMTRSVETAQRKLRTLPTGGKTPLAAGLLKGAETLAAMKGQNTGHVPALILLTDGRANVRCNPERDPLEESRDIAGRIAEMGIQALVIDTESGYVKLGYAKRLASELGAAYCLLDELEAGRIEQAVRGLIHSTTK